MSNMVLRSKLKKCKILMILTQIALQFDGEITEFDRLW